MKTNRPNDIGGTRDGRKNDRHKPNETEDRMKAGKIWEFIRNSFVAMLRGEFLLRLRFDRFFMHILYFFILCGLNIWLTLKIEQTMLNEERNKAKLEELKIYHAQKTCELVSFDRLSTVEELLKKNGSKLTVPEKPADRIK